MGLFGIKKDKKKQKNNNQTPNNQFFNNNMNNQVTMEQMMQGTPEMQQEMQMQNQQMMMQQQMMNNQMNQQMMQQQVNQMSTETEQIETLESLEDNPSLPRQNEVSSEPEQTANPLDNDKNLIPVNPIAPKEEVDVEEILLQKDAKATIMAAIGIIMGMILKPGNTMVTNAKKFKDLGKAIKITLWLSFIFIIASLVVRFIVGSFTKSYNAVTGAYSVSMDFANLLNLDNYLEYLVIAIVLSLVGVFLVAVIYYASSFLNSKGVPFSTYLIISNLGMIPFLMGVIILYPILDLISSYLGIAILIFAFLSTIINILIGMNEVLKFNSLNNKIYYHVINLSIITLIVLALFLGLARGGFIELPQITM